MSGRDGRSGGAGVPEGVDHLIYGAPELERGVEAVEERLGVRPAAGGRHPAYGTRNALLALGPACYLEVMAPDPDLPRPGRGTLFGLEELEGPRLVTWALRAEGIEGAAARAREAGVGLGPVESGSRENPGGEVLTWRLTDPRATPLGGAVPFLIAWGETPHPAAGAPDGGELAGLRVEHPQPELVRVALETLGARVPVSEGERPGLAATIRTAGGSVELR